MPTDNSDQAVLAEVLNFLRSWPPHPTTAAMIRKVEAQLCGAGADERQEVPRVWVGSTALCEAPSAHLVTVKAKGQHLQLHVAEVDTFEARVGRGDLLRHIGSGSYVELVPAATSGPRSETAMSAVAAALGLPGGKSRSR